MNYFKTVIFLIFFLNTAYATFNGLTIHSRANCINNESISWDWTTYYIFATKSLHAYEGRPVHWDGTGWQNTWRSAAVCWGEAPITGHGPWIVQGRHHIKDCNNCRIKELGVTNVDDCSIYNGWWDSNKGGRNMKNTLSGLLFIPLSTLAADISKQPRIEIVSQSSIYKDYSSQDLKMIENERQQIKEKGYIEGNGRAARMLLSMRYGDMIEAQKKSVKNLLEWSSPYDTHLKYNISDIKLAFKFKEIKLPEIQRVIGYAPVGMWVKEKEGWSGIVSFYNMKNLGICKLEIFNIAITNGSVKVPEDQVRYDINNKLTSTLVMGTKKDGFIYSVGWDDKNFIHELKCATPDYDSSMIDKMIPVAKKIDKEVN